jgi:fucose 4-O-acetylase-like acetyltransferase
MKNATTPSDNSKKSRLAWIDIAKAIGLFFIIIGHLTINKYNAAKYIYWFHVPFFFLISGLLHSSAQKIPRFIAARFKHLMVPYCVMVCCTLVMIMTGLGTQLSVKNLLLGGHFLDGTAYAKWWFIPCLFFAQVAGILIIKTGRRRFVIYAACFCYYTAEMLQISNTVWIWGYPFVILNLPFALEIVPMAIFFYLTGFLLNDCFINANPLPWSLTVLFTLSVAGTILIDWFNIVNIPVYGMSAQRYGLPIFNIAMPLFCFFLIRELSITLSRFSTLKKILSSIGRAALPIMFLHTILSIYAVHIFSKFTGLNVGNLFVRAALGVLLPWGLYSLLRRFSVTKKLVLGEWH